ncbi:MAG: hypothetical protein HQ574_09420 [Chloroflexi bacterium]|nr:hypothetical protein [Chloroflexota bacterium]
MKTRTQLFYLIMLLTTSMILYGCGPVLIPPEDIKEGEEILIDTEILATDEAAKFEVEIAEHPDNPNLADIRVINSSGQEIFTITLEDIYTGHYHSGEFQGEHLYIIKRFGTEDNYSSELWRYGLDEIGELLYTSDSFNFRVSPDENYIAIRNWIPGVGGEEQIIFVDQIGELIRTINPKSDLPEDEMNTMMDLEGWSADGSILWGTHGVTWIPRFFYTIDVNTWEITTYDVSDLPIQSEYAFNPSTSQLLFSDMPTYVEMSGYTYFLIEQTPVRLYLKDFSDGKQIPLEVSIAQSFRPEWITDDLVVYDDPVGRGRIQFRISDGSTRLIPGEPKEEILVHPREIPLEFEPVMDSLLETGTGIMLPSAFPVQEGSPSVYPEVSMVSRGTYWISLAVGEDCQTGQGCYYGFLGARKFGVGGGSEASMMPFWGRSQFTYVPLTHQIPGYLVLPSCDTCSQAELYWIYNNTEYELKVVSANQNDLIAIANLMIENSVPPLEGD